MNAFSSGSDGRGLARAGLLCVPCIAHAQQIPAPFALAVVSPLPVIALAVGLGILTRSWRTAGRHAALILLWVALAGVFAYRAENDYVIWAPLLAYALHSVLIVCLVVLQVVRRVRVAARAAGGHDGG